MPKLIMTKGLPASGKTTWAKEQVKNGKGRVKRVNKDDLRAMIDAGEWSRKNEENIINVRDAIIIDAMGDGFDIIVDDTNLDPKHEERLRLLGGKNFEIKDFTDVPLAECLKRNRERANFVPEETIKSMYNKYLKGKTNVAKYEAPPYNPDLPMCIIVDIDGTLAHGTGRNMYDYSMVHTDAVDDNVAEIVRRYARRDPNTEIPDTYVIIVSGRDNSCQEETIKWLQDNQIPFDEFYMRDPSLVDEKGNKLDDTVIKRDIYNEFIKPRFNVRFVLDDRDRVVKMWREEGLKVLQVQPGDF